MDYLLYLQLYIFFQSVSFGSCWQYFTKYEDIITEDSWPETWHLHSEYIYGECKRQDLIYYTKVELDHMEVLGKLIVRGWLEIMRIPLCIKVRGYAHNEDLFRSTAYNFQICVPRISYCHSQNRWKYHYYEWYIPINMIGGMNWKLLFFGPKTMEWG